MRVWIAALVLCVATARAGDVPSAGGFTSADTGESHSWVVLPGKVGASVQHLPPRGRDAQGRPGVDDGSVRIATALTQMPVAIAAVEDRVFMVFPPKPGAGTSSRPVLWLRAQRRSVDGDWVGESSEGRLPSVAGLPGEGRLRGFVGTPAGLVALLGDGERLLGLFGESWMELSLPEERFSGTVRLVGSHDGIGVVTVGPQPVFWSRRLQVPRGSKEPEQARWTKRELNFADTQSGRPEEPASDVYEVRGQLVYANDRDGTVEVRTVNDRGSSLLATIAAVPRGYAVVPLEQTGRVALVWREAAPATGVAKDQSAGRLMIVEVSALTGQVLYRGEADPQRPFSPVELKVFAAFLVVVMLAIVVFVLRPDPSPLALSLPKGVVLAEPGRRVMAGVFDAGLSLVIASQVTGIKPGSLLSFKVLVTQPDALTLYLVSIGIGAALGAVCEWLFGKTFGKSLVGVEVVRPRFGKAADGQVIPQVGKVSLGRAVARNTVKWVLPPVAMSGLSSPERRHRGDLAAGTVVVVREEPPEA